MPSDENESPPAAPGSEPEDGTSGALEDAELRQAWLTSAERRSFSLFVWLMVFSVLIAAVIDFLIVKRNYSENVTANPAYPFLVATPVLVWAYLAVFIAIFRRRVLRRAFNDRRLIAKARNELREAEDIAYANAETDFASLWKVTQKRLDYYHQIATGQAERSFLYSQIAAATGFAVLLVSAIVAAFATSLIASISSAIAGISAGGLGAYVGSTFMRSQNMAATQLREYFRQPLGFSNYLAAERLLTDLDKADRAGAVRDIIKAMVSNHDASFSHESKLNNG